MRPPDRLVRLLTSCSLLLIAAVPLRAAEKAWQAGFATVDITPGEPVMLAGYASRSNPATGTLDRLHAKALALDDGTGQLAILLTADLIGFRADMAAMICSRITAATGVPRERILLNASHTHTGPLVMLTSPAHDKVTEAQGGKSITYTRRLMDQCVEVAGRATKSLRAVKLSTGSGVVNFPMNRREFTERGVILGVNPRGPVDRSVPVLRIESPDGKLLGVVFGATCHNTTFGSRDNEVSGDFAGAAQAHIEKEFPGTTALFLQGLAGDANPYPNSHNDPAKRPAVDIARDHGGQLGREVARVLNTTLRPVNGPLRAAFDLAQLPLQPAPAQDELEKLAKSGPSAHRFTAGQMLGVLATGGKLPTHYGAPVSVWQFGNDLTLVGLSGEVVVDYVRLIEEAVGPLKLWISGYSHDVFGYVPSARVLREGGYETRGLYTGGPGFFAPTAQDVLVAKVRELAARAGRAP
jgi:hypothetical protein